MRENISPSTFSMEMNSVLIEREMHKDHIT